MQRAIDVVMPVYRGRRWVAESVISVLNQTVDNWHLWIVDDACPEGTAEVVREIWPTGDDRLTIIRNPTNLGQVDSRGRAVSLGGGRFVTLLDQDDVCASNRFERLLDVADDRTVVYSNALVIDETSTPLQDQKYSANERRERYPLDGLGREKAVACLFRNNLINIGTALFPRKLWTDVGGQEGGRLFGGEDWGFWVKAACADYRFRLLKENLLLRRIHQNQGSHDPRRAVGMYRTCRVLRRRYALRGPDFDRRERDLWGQAVRVSPILAMHAVCDPKRLAWLR